MVCLVYGWLWDRIGDWRLGSMGLKQGSSFLSVKRPVKEGSEKRPLSPQVASLGNLEEGGLLYRGLREKGNYLESSFTRVSERYV
jgi:hypothetical protein